MKFGSYLKAHKDEAFAEFYLDYEGLDDLIMALTEVENASLNVDVGKSGYGERVTSLSMVPNGSATAKFRGKDVAEGDLFTWLEQEMAKVDKFTHDKLQGIKRKIEELVERCTESGLGDKERRDALKEAKELGDEFVRIEKFANLNYLGFHKILKKHDKQLPRTPCRRFYLMRLHQQRWIKEDYSSVFSSLSKLHAHLRGEAAAVALSPLLASPGAGALGGVGAEASRSRYVEAYWVRTENISAVKNLVVQNLPVVHYEAATGAGAAGGDSDLVSTVYLDNTQLELYHGVLDHMPEASELGLRWYGSEAPKLVYVERTQFVEGWNGFSSNKKRFSLQPYQVMPFLNGEFTAKDKAREMTAAGASADEVADATRLMNEVFYMVDAKQLEPKMRTVEKRASFASPTDPRVRVSLETALRMQLEAPRDGPDLLAENRWFRNPARPVMPDEITLFPHALLEIKLSMREGEAPPEWVQALINSGYLTLVKRFTKFVHGCAALLQEDAQALPFWVDDESIQKSIMHGSSISRKGDGDDEDELGDSDKEDGAKKDKKKDKEAKQLARTTSGGAAVDLMAKRSNSYIMMAEGGEERGAGSGAGGYGTLLQDGNKATAAAAAAAGMPMMNVPRQRSSLLAWLCEGLLWSGEPQYEKMPLKLEPKVFLANERVFLNWLQMASTIATVAVALLGVVTPGADGVLEEGERAAHVTGMILLPLAILFCVYAINTFYWRGKRIRRRTKTEDIHDDMGAFLLGALVFSSMAAILAVNLLEGHPVKKHPKP